MMNNYTDTYQKIINHPFFKTIKNKKIIDYLLQNLKIKTFQKKELIISYDEENISPIILFIQGTAKLAKINHNGIEQILHLYNSYGIYISNQSNPHQQTQYCQSLSNNTIITLISTKVLNKICETEPSFYQILNYFILINYQQSLYHLEQISLKSAKERVASFLIHNYHNPHLPKQNVLQNFDKQTIACYLNIKPETFSRCLKLLKKEGIVENKYALVKNNNTCKYCDYISGEHCENRHKCKHL